MGQGGTKVAAKSSVVILAIACVFSSVFFLEFENTGYDVVSTIAVRLFDIAFLLVPMAFSYRLRISMRTIYTVSVALIGLQLALAFTQGPLTEILGFAVRGAAGLSVLSIGASLSFFSMQQARRTILLGFACTALFVPLFHLFTRLNAVQIQRTLLIGYVVCIGVFLLLEKQAQNQPFAPVTETIGKYRSKGKRWIAILFTQNSSTLIALVVTVIFFFCFGMFEEYSNANGFGFATSNPVMIGIFCIAFILFLMDNVKQINAWFRVVFSTVWVIYVISFFAVLLLTDFPPVLFDIMGVGIVILHIPIWIFLAEASIEQSFSPIFLFGAMTAVLFVAHIGGQLLTLILIYALGLDALNISGLAAGSLAAVAITVIFVLAVVDKRRERVDELDMAQIVQFDSVEETEWFDKFANRFGLSEREREIIFMYSQGRTSAYIASSLFLSESTVKTHIKRAYAKLDVHSRQELLDVIEESKAILPDGKRRII